MTLTEFSYYTRKSMPFGVLALLVLLIFFYLIKILFFIGGSSHKPTNSVSTKLFPGETIQAPSISGASPSANLNLTLDTIEGKPLTATLSAEIFVLPPSSTKFGFREKILLMAKTLGFDTDATKYKINDKTALFEDDVEKLTVDISTFNFEYQYQLQNDPNLFTNTLIPTEAEIIEKATDFLRSIDRYPEDFAKSTPSITYLTYNKDTTGLDISSTPQPSSNMVEVDFFRPEIQATPLNISTVTSKFPNSHNYVAMVFNDQNEKVVKAQVKFFEKSPEQVGVYPLKTGDLAWEQLKSGKGYVVNGSPSATSITVKKMYLAYYDPDVYQPYLQPVYVFIGDNNFVGLVPAVEDRLLIQ